MKKFYAVLFALALVAGLSASRPVSAQARTAYTRVTGNSLALTGTPAAIVTAVSAKAIRVKRVFAGAGTDATIQFYNGSGTGSPIGFPIRIESTAALTQVDLGPGIVTSVGTALYVSGDQTVSIGLEIQEE